MRGIGRVLLLVASLGLLLAGCAYAPPGYYYDYANGAYDYYPGGIYPLTYPYPYPYGYPYYYPY